jgi:GntR family transcriptional regulator, gluconate operon transcriptional repressor
VYVLDARARRVWEHLETLPSRDDSALTAAVAAQHEGAAATRIVSFPTGVRAPHLLDATQRDGAAPAVAQDESPAAAPVAETHPGGWYRAPDWRLDGHTAQRRAAGRAVPLWQDAAHSVRRAIVSGELKHGARVSEASLAETLGVSRAPVRDAIRVLVQEGLLLQGPWATTVVGCAPGDIEQLFDLRAHLEAYAIRLAAPGLGRDAAAALRRAADAMAAAASEGDTGAYTGADLDFHRALVGAARHRWLSTSWEHLAPVIAATLPLGADGGRRPRAVVAAGHHEILRYLREGDALSAEATLRRHIRGAAAHLIERFGAARPAAADRPPRRRARGHRLRPAEPETPEAPEVPARGVNVPLISP